VEPAPEPAPALPPTACVPALHAPPPRPVLPAYVPPDRPAVDTTRARLVEIRGKIPTPQLGCLLCRGKWEDVVYLSDLIAHIEAEIAPLADAPTQEAPALAASDDAAAAAAAAAIWRRACQHVGEQLALELAKGRRAGWDIYRVTQAVKETVEQARRRPPPPSPDLWDGR
jgi:hypothetical protein